MTFILAISKCLHCCIVPNQPPPLTRWLQYHNIMCSCFFSIAILFGLASLALGQSTPVSYHRLNSSISGFYYSPTHIGVDGNDGLNAYVPYFTQIHQRDLQVIRSMGNTIRISSLGTKDNNNHFLDLARQHNLSVIASFGLQLYVELNKPQNLQQQLARMRTDFEKFISEHKQNEAIVMWCLGDVEDFVFSIDTSVEQYLYFILVFILLRYNGSN